jgi:hypothetical protein
MPWPNKKISEISDALAHDLPKLKNAVLPQTIPWQGAIFFSPKATEMENILLELST